MRRLLCFALAIGLASPCSAAGEPDLRTVLDRTAAYVASFTKELSGVVAEESYVQDVEVSAARRTPGVTHRELKSDFLLVDVPGRGYIEFRDVFEVDGRSVRDRQDRLSRLFLSRSSAGPQAESIMDESARYNIGRATRTINTQPMLPLTFLEAGTQPEFQFKRVADARPANFTAAEAAAYGLTASVWVVEFRETARGAFLRTPQNKYLKAQGRVWIEPEAGRVVMTELTTDDYDVATTIDVSYQFEAALGRVVPAEMRERYVLSPDNQLVKGVATYSHFRRFSVQTDEALAPPK